METIKFNYIGKYAYDVIDKPRPANEFIPEWHKNMPTYAKTPLCPAGDKLSTLDGGTNVTAKKCMPMLDSISEGYIIPLWADVHVQQTLNGPYLGWMVDKDVFSVHGSPYPGMVPPFGFSNLVFKFMTYMRIETPPGYSIMVRTPSGHNDLPVRVISSTVDTDKSVIDSNIPCVFKEGFEGVIKRGTPIAQIVPFKRQPWKAEVDIISEEDFNNQLNRDFLTCLKDNYVKKFWSRKKYE